MNYYTQLDTPLGQLHIQGDGRFVTGLYLPDHKGWAGPDGSSQCAVAPFTAVREQLAAYFAGERQQFDVPIKLTGTPFQERVWWQLTQIPFGETISYAELARRVGSPAASRAVGAANGRNSISILVPCHRVVGATGRLTGYAGGVEKKQWLLEWERRAMASGRLARRVG